MPDELEAECPLLPLVVVIAPEDEELCELELVWVVVEMDDAVTPVDPVPELDAAELAVTVAEDAVAADELVVPLAGPEALAALDALWLGLLPQATVSRARPVTSEMRSEVMKSREDPDGPGTPDPFTPQCRTSRRARARYYFALASVSG